MSDRDTSRTAFGTAYMRAAHQLIDKPPVILDDTVIVKLIGQPATVRIIQAPELYQTQELQALRSHVVLRSRFAEDRLSDAVKRGVEQYIILGAGLDTFAYRQPEWASQLRIFEIDHPGTQNTKVKLLKSAKIDIPKNVTLASIDFEKETLKEGLLRHRISFTYPTFFSWLGVTMYLNESAIDSVLSTITNFPKGSEIVLTYARSDDTPSTFERRSADLGEPWLSFFTIDAMEAKLNKLGFTKIEFLDVDKADKLYFRESGGSLRVPLRTNIVSAVV
jgi:methyltransferase (TIGR00027 family)